MEDEKQLMEEGEEEEEKGRGQRSDVFKCSLDGTTGFYCK